MPKEPVKKTLYVDPQNLHAYSTGLLQGKAYSRLHKYLTCTLIPFGVSIPEWKLLGQLHEHGKMRLAELAEYLSYDPPMVTKLVKRLEKKAMVKRAEDKYDERAKVITITNEGRILINNTEPLVKMAMGKILEGISKEELVTYLKVLTVIVNNTK